MKVERGRGWTMYLGDCLEVMPTVESVDHVITDPPYEAEAHTLQRRKAAGWRHHKTGMKVQEAPLDFAAMTDGTRRAAGAAFARVTKRWALVFCQVEAAMLWREALAPLVYRRTCVWTKPDGQPQLSGDRPGMGYESIVASHAKSKSRWNGGGRLGVFRFPKNEGGALIGIKNDHPTQKPLALLQELVTLFTDPGETILDGFAGSGTAGVACIRLGRQFIGIEKDPKYFALACDRLRAEESGSTLAAQRAGQGALFGGDR